MMFLKQITTLVLTLQVSFSKELETQIESATEQGPAIARNDVKQIKRIHSSEGQNLTLADNFTINETEEKLKLLLEDEDLDNDTYYDVSNRRMNSVQRIIINTIEDQKGIMSRFNDDLKNLQLKVNRKSGRVISRSGNVKSRAKDNKENSCQWKQDEVICLPTDCTDAMKITGESGVHKLSHTGTIEAALHTYCLKDDASGDPWTVIQRRFNGVVDFDRTWQEYKKGFGCLDDEFWLGLDHIYSFTNSAKHELRIKLKNVDNKIYVAKYDNFIISDEGSNYKLDLGEHSGNASEGLKKFHSGKMWTTKDKVNDPSSANCPKTYQSGWWFDNCAYSNLNGNFAGGKGKKFKTIGRGIIWGSIQNTSFTYSEMAIRAKK